MRLLPTLRPYPRPGSRHYRDAIYAVTHIVYTLNDYNRSRLPPPLLRRERAFLKAEHGLGDQAGRCRYGR